MLEAGLLNRAREHHQRFIVGVEQRPPAAFIGHTGQLAGRLHQRARCEIDLGGHFERFGKCLCAQRHHHEVLNIHAPSGMGATAKYLNLGQRHCHRPPL